MLKYDIKIQNMLIMEEVEVFVCIKVVFNKVIEPDKETAWLYWLFGASHGNLLVAIFSFAIGNWILTDAKTLQTESVLSKASKSYSNI